ncbi:hypothetical protein ACEW7V_01575 [Areca yellow leaf disease phytoplasma]|uniref:hypothetical protein n=1 Tax=Areca yellow leaf disease phytoplasma TaxID=927614 RepID=UPI0035B53FC3
MKLIPVFDEVFLTSLDPLINHLKAKILLFSATITEQLKPFINRYFSIKSTFIDVYKQSNLNRTFLFIRNNYKQNADLNSSYQSP